MPNDHVDRLVFKLARLRKLDRKFLVFGAGSHRYELHPKLNEAAVLGFEEGHGVRLPEDYRQFLLAVGNGGAGPHYGLFSLGEMDGSGSQPASIPWRKDDGLVGRLSSPFPHSAAWNLPREQIEPPGEFASDEAENRWVELFEQLYWNSDLVNGAIPICHHGCALRTWLVVTGDQRGRVWRDERADNDGLSPHLGSRGEHQTFADWYEAWLDDSLKALAQ